MTKKLLLTGILILLGLTAISPQVSSAGIYIKFFPKYTSPKPPAELIKDPWQVGSDLWRSWNRQGLSWTAPYFGPSSLERPIQGNGLVQPASISTNIFPSGSEYNHLWWYYNQIVKDDRRFFYPNRDSFANDINTYLNSVDVPVYTPQTPPPYKGAPGYYLIPDLPGMGGPTYVPLNLPPHYQPVPAPVNPLQIG